MFKDIPELSLNVERESPTKLKWWPQRDVIELAELKCAISLRAEGVSLQLRAGKV